MNNIRPNQQRAKIAILMILIVGSLDFLTTISEFLRYRLLKSISEGANVTTGVAESSDLMQQVLAGIYMLAYFISIVTFLLWFRRGYFNLHERVEGINYTEGWAVGAWFIPFLNLLRPLQIMKEMYIESDALIPDENKNYQINNKLSIVGWWWGFWIVNNVVSNLQLRLTMNATTIEDHIFTTSLGMISSAIGIPLAILAAIVIRDYSKMETTLENITEGGIDDPIYDSLVV